MTAIGLARSEIVVAGRTLEVARVTTGSDKQPIVLLHEGLGSIDMWRGFPDRLAQATGRDRRIFTLRPRSLGTPARSARRHVHAR